MNVYFGLCSVTLKQNKQTEKRPSIKKENKWMKNGKDYVSNKHLFKEHTFRLLRNYCSIILLL